MPTEFPLSLKDLRLALGLNQDDMAGLLQVTRSQLSMAELGLRPPGAAVLLRVHRINQLLAELPASFPASASNEEKRTDWLKRLQAEQYRLVKRLEALISTGNQNQYLSALLANMDSLQNADFNAELDQRWADMMAAAQPDPEEAAWEMFRLKIELETLEWKIQRVGNSME